ncbi:MAG: acetylglutamate kinase [Myxococcota bacterium]
MDRVITLTDAVPYLRAYAGQTFVIKVGGAIVAEEEWRRAVVHQCAVLHRVGMGVVLVHGGGPQLKAVAASRGIAAPQVAGRRITSDALLEVAIEQWRGRLSTQLVDAFRQGGETAVGLCGADGDLVTAARRPPVSIVDDAGATRLVDFGRVGDLQSVDVTLLHAILANRMIPVVSPLAASSQGLLNVNADSIAAALAIALPAAKLILVGQTPGILENPTDETSALPVADLATLDRLESKGSVQGGMRPKVEAIRTALRGGVPRVHLVDGRDEDGLLAEIFTHDGSGTLVVAEGKGEGVAPA